MIALGERISEPPYILGNFPRMELVFALADPETKAMAPGVPAHDKYADLERLKRLLDQGAITPDEYERETQKLLQ